jgi:hypothetical protein
MKKKIFFGALILIVALAGAYLLVTYQSRKAARQQVESVAFQIPGVRAIDYHGVDINWRSNKARLEAVTVFMTDPEETIRIDEILVHSFDPAHEVPDHLDVEVLGIHLHADQPRMARLEPYLVQTDFQELILNLRCAYRYDRTSRLLTVEKLAIEAADAGSLDLKARFKNINLPRLIRNLGDKVYLITALPGASIAGAELSYTDDTLARRLIATWAAKTGQSPDEVARHLAGALEQQVGHPERQLTREAVDGLKAFIAEPDTLQVAATPPAPVSFLRFFWTKHPSDVIELLHIRVGG